MTIRSVSAQRTRHKRMYVPGWNVGVLAKDVDKIALAVVLALQIEHIEIQQYLRAPNASQGRSQVQGGRRDIVAKVDKQHVTKNHNDHVRRALFAKVVSI